MATHVQLEPWLPGAAGGAEDDVLGLDLHIDGDTEELMAAPPAAEVQEAEEGSPEGATALAMYFHEMAAHRVLTAEEELRAVREIEELEIRLWQELLAWAPATEWVLQLTESTQQGQEGATEVTIGLTPPLKRALLKAAAEARSKPNQTTRGKLAACARKAAEKLRAVDVDKESVQAVLAALHQVAAGTRAVPHHPSVARGKPAFSAYLQKVEAAAQAAVNAREGFIKANLRLVVSMARRYRRDLLSLGDLIQEGNIGLMKGLSRYDHRRGVKFSTYASWWIRHAINRALADKGREVRVPVHLLEAQKQVAKAQRELDHKLGRWATTEELSEHTAVPSEKIQRLRTYLREHSVSLDAPVGADGDNDHGLMEIFSDPNRDADSPLDSLASEEMSEKVGQLMKDVLKPMEADILRRRFGFQDDREFTLKEIGKEYNLSRERVRQLQMQSLRKIREALRRRHML
jgi:RNA polymerase primary sigma factor